MAERDDGPEDDGPRFGASGPVLATAAVGIVVVLFYLFELGLTPWAAWGGIVAIATAALLAQRRRRQPRRRPAEERQHWPDSGVKAVVQAMAEPCFVVDGRGRIRFFNEAATAHFGPARVGDPLSFRLRVPAFLEVLERVAGGGDSDRIAWSERVPAERWYEANVTPLRLPLAGIDAGRGSKPELVLVAVRDLTEIQRLERLRADFVANASHELRTPLAAVSGFIETLQGPAKNDPAARERFLAVMAAQAARMKRLIDDLLSLSRIEMRSHVQPTGWVELGSIVAHVAETLGAVAAENEVAIEIDVPAEPITVRGDRDELVQLTANLVENAIKYGGSGGRVVVSVKPEAGERRRGATLSVRDFGPGIAPEHLPRLTERFYRADVQASRAAQGTGLGLAIVKHIVGRHRGRLTIESPASGGALFSVRLDRDDGAVSEIVE